MWASVSLCRVQGVFWGSFEADKCSQLWVYGRNARTFGVLVEGFATLASKPGIAREAESFNSTFNGSEALSTRRKLREACCDMWGTQRAATGRAVAAALSGVLVVSRAETSSFCGYSKTLSR